MSGITYEESPPLNNDVLNALFDAAWEEHERSDFAPVLAHSLVYVAAFDGARLVGFVNLATDGGGHAFLLDTTVHRGHQRRGIGAELVRRAILAAAERGVEWVHVDFEPHLEGFYRRAGFRHTAAGLINLRGE
jgi:GNAT superfamily N-acetyltransferase